VEEGDLYSVRSGDGRYSVAKILKLEEGVVHLRIYANRYPERPLEVRDEDLTLGTVFDEEFGLGHLPFDAAAFETWEPQLLRHGTVEEEELEGYQMWREAEDEGAGGVWGRDENGGLLGRLRRLFRRP
jgi:hypothetical protein